jgi:hypothetical protein
MRSFILGLITLALSSVVTAADPYRWCAEYSGRGGGTNCYFVTLEQCRTAISGNGGFCRQNGFYDGQPVTTPDRRSQPRVR